MPKIFSRIAKIGFVLTGLLLPAGLSFTLLSLLPSALAQVQPGQSPLSGAKGGTGNAFMSFTGPATTPRTYTLPNQDDTIATLGFAQTWSAPQTFSIVNAVTGYQFNGGATSGYFLRGNGTNFVGSAILAADLPIIPLTKGGLGGDQSAAAAGTIPTFPGGGSAALDLPPLGPHTIIAASPPYSVVCDGLTDQTTAINSALAASGAASVLLPPNGTGACIIGSATTLLSVPAGVTLYSLGGTTLKLPTVATSATGASNVSASTVAVTSCSGISTGMAVTDNTSGFALPGTVSSCASTTLTMSTHLYTASHATNASAASNTAVLSFAAGVSDVFYGMQAYDVTQSRVLPGTTNLGGGATTITMSSNVGGSGVGSGDTIEFGWPVASSDVVTAGQNYTTPMVALLNNSTVKNITLDMGNLDDADSAAIGGNAATGWVVDHVKIINAGTYGIAYTDVANHQITNNRVTWTYPSNKNNSSAILSFCSISYSNHGLIANNTFNGAGVQNCDKNARFVSNDIYNYLYGAGFSDSSTELSGNLYLGNYIHDSGSGFDSNDTAPDGFELLNENAPVIVGNTVATLGGPALALGSRSATVSGNSFYDNGSSNPGNVGAIVCYPSPVGLGCHRSIITGNLLGNVATFNTGWGYYESTSAPIGVTLGANTYPSVTQADVSLYSGSLTGFPLFPEGLGAPTIASGACGTGTNGAVVTGSTNQSGSITIGPAVTGSCTVTFSTTLSAAPRACVIQPNNAAAAIATTGAYIFGITTGAFTIVGTLANANYGYLCL